MYLQLANLRVYSLEVSVFNQNFPFETWRYACIALSYLALLRNPRAPMVHFSEFTDYPQILSN